MHISQSHWMLCKMGLHLQHQLCGMWRQKYDLALMPECHSTELIVQNITFSSKKPVPLCVQRAASAGVAGLHILSNVNRKNHQAYKMNMLYVCLPVSACQY